jgi:hypothetical protein
LAVAATKLEFEKSPQIMELYNNASIPDNVKRFNSTMKPNNNNNKPKMVEANTTRVSSSMQQGNMHILGMRNEAPRGRQHPSVQELLKKQYVFKRAMIRGFFNQVVEHNHIKLPDPKRPDQVGMNNNPLYCPYHRYVGHVIKDYVAFKEWLQRAIDEKRLTLQPDAINPDYHAVNMVSIGTCPENSVEAGEWVPLMQLEKDLTNIHLSQGTPKASANQWGTAMHYKLPRRDFQHREASQVASYSKKSVAYPDGSCLCLKGMHNSRDMAELYQHLRNSCLMIGSNLFNPQLQQKMLQERGAMRSSNVVTTLVVLAPTKA